jgi:expansin (peptidoglycan-binding protein)
MLRPSLLLLLVPALAIAASACSDAGSGAGSGTGSGATSSSSETSSASSGGSVGSSCQAPMEHTGEGTYYDADGSGNCSFDPTSDLMVAAMNQTDYAASAACGACAHIVGPSGEVTVRIVDRCPECKPGDIDLSPEAFSKFADLKLGRVKIAWNYVPCDVQGPIVYHFKEGSNQYWTAVQVRNARHAIAKFEFQKSGQYVPVNRLDYNYFVADKGMGPGPYAFRVTDVNGDVLEDQGIAFKEAGDAPGAQQLPACSK